MPKSLCGEKFYERHAVGPAEFDESAAMLPCHRFDVFA